LGRLRALDQIVILAIASASLLDPDPERFIRGLLVAARSNIRMINDRSDPAELPRSNAACCIQGRASRS
jgi:hypothetical protein